MTRMGTAARQIGPEFTPPAVRWIILLTASLSIALELADGFLRHFFSNFTLESLLSLSWGGLKKLYLWQPASYLFFYTAGGQGITLWWLLSLAFALYIIWLMGSHIAERYGNTAFLKFYLVNGAAAGIATVCLSAFFGFHPLLAGPTAALFATLMAWTMLNPESQIFLFFVIPLKARTLVAFLLALLTLTSLSQGDISSFFLYISGAAGGYLYVVIAWELNGPYPWMQPFDDAIWNWGRRAGKLFKWPKSGKIIALNGQDERFMDEMLEKISKEGEESLSWRERRKMKRISKRKTRHINK